MKTWDILKRILNEKTVDKTIALENITILFEPSLKINISAFLREATNNRMVILKLDHELSNNRYYPFMDNHSYFLDFTGIDIDIF